MSCGNTALKSQASENYVLAGQRVLVTDANSGIGAAIAQALAIAGAAVVVNYGRGQEEAERVVVRIKSEGGEAIAIQADVSQEDEVKAMFRQMFATYGSIDILVNNTGTRKDAALTTLTLTEWEYVLHM